MALQTVFLTIIVIMSSETIWRLYLGAGFNLLGGWGRRDTSP